jgi:hypothetical protein
MIHTVAFTFQEHLPLAALLHTNIITRQIPKTGSEPGTFFEVVEHPSFILIANRNRSTNVFHVFKVQLALSDHYTTFAEFCSAIEAVFAPNAFHPDNTSLQRIDYFVDLPILLQEAVRGAVYGRARGYAYGKGVFGQPRQIVIGNNPCLAVYDRGRRLQRLSRNQPHRVRAVPEGPVSRFEVRYKREVQNGIQLLPLELMTVFHPDQLIDHARTIGAGGYDPFAEAQYYDTSVAPAVELMHLRGTSINWNGPEFRERLRRYTLEVERTARIRGMMELANLHLVRAYCNSNRELRSTFATIARRLETPFDLGSLFRAEIRRYFGLARPRPRLTP